MSYRRQNWNEHAMATGKVTERQEIHCKVDAVELFRSAAASSSLTHFPMLGFALRERSPAISVLTCFSCISVHVCPLSSISPLIWPSGSESSPWCLPCGVWQEHFFICSADVCIMCKFSFQKKAIHWLDLELKEKFYPGLGLEPEPLAFHANALTN